MQHDAPNPHEHALQAGDLVVVMAEPGSAAPHGTGRVTELRPADRPRVALVTLDAGPTVLVGLSRLERAA
ncbi:MAG: hypothetical protein IT196_25405 [Acidimicrobiales bacterium]|nr:hypothetical protein [Acidimicrobiales bacterium]